MNNLISREAVNDVIIWHETDGSIATRKALDRIAKLPTVPAIPISVIEQIKAEIKQNSYPIVHGVNNHEQGMTVYGIMRVIDHHIKEYTE